jgi:hypothetical protein
VRASPEHRRREDEVWYGEIEGPAVSGGDGDWCGSEKCVLRVSFMQVGLRDGASSCSHRCGACSMPKRPSQPAARHPGCHAADRGKWMHDESGRGEGNFGGGGPSVDDLARAWIGAPPGGRSRCSKRRARGPGTAVLGYQSEFSSPLSVH